MFNTRSRNFAVAALVAGLLSACGGGGSYTQVNRNPQLQGLTDQSFAQDTSVGPLAFTVTDADSGAAQVSVTATSSDTSIIAADGIAIAGSGSARTLQITPAPDAIGTANVTVRAVDPSGYSTTATIRVQVNGVYASFLDTAKTVFAADESGTLRTVIGTTFTSDADDDPAAFDTLLQ